MAGQTITAQRLELAHGHDRCCRLCQHRCGADRLGGEQGFCQAGVTARVYRHRIECGDEIELVPSHLFYLSGCDLRCVFCIGGASAVDPGFGRPLTSEFLNRALAWGRQQGARNLQWVGGEPTIHLPAILEAMAGCRDLPPVVWKSNFHATAEAMKLLSGVVQVYVADFKFGNDGCARAIAGVEPLFPDRHRQPAAGRGTGRLDRAAPLAARPFRLLLPAGGRLDAAEPAAGEVQHPRRILSLLALGGAGGIVAAPVGQRRPAGPVPGAGQRTERNRLEARAVDLDDETTLSEITIMPDGRVYVFGALWAVLDALVELNPGDAALRRRSAACVRKLCRDETPRSVAARGGQGP